MSVLHAAPRSPRAQRRSRAASLARRRRLLDQLGHLVSRLQSEEGPSHAPRGRHEAPQRAQAPPLVDRQTNLDGHARTLRRVATLPKSWLSPRPQDPTQGQALQLQIAPPQKSAPHTLGGVEPSAPSTRSEWGRPRPRIAPRMLTKFPALDAEGSADTRSPA